MRTFILIAGLVLASATAQAGERSLSLDPVDAPTVTVPSKATDKATDTTKTAEAPQAVDAPKTDAPKYIERPAVVEPKPEPQKVEAAKPATPKAEQTGVEPEKPIVRKTASRNDKPRRQRYWTESRIIGELHRHGIYW